MGNGRWSAEDWGSYARSSVTGKSRAEVFTARGLDPKYDPAQIAFRESRDSAANPSATPILIGSDVTGSMGRIAHKLMQDGLNTLATEIYDRKPVPDPHIGVLAIGDAECDSAPLQATQFEASIILADQVRSLWLESGGGGNSGESYSAAHLFAALKVKSDAFEKRGQKGFLFTIGDEPILDGMKRHEIERVFGITAERGLSAAECLRMASRTFEVFHVVLANEGYARTGLDRVLRTWKAILPERTILLDDVDRLAEVVVSVLQVHQGARAEDVAASWSGKTSLVVASALQGMVQRRNGTGGVRRLTA